MGRTIIVGSPCSGKSTYARERAQRGDLVYDYDTLHQALSGLDSHQHLPEIRPYVLAARDAIYQMLESNAQMAWIITSTPKDARLRELAERLQADVVLLPVDRDEAHRRCDADGRPQEWHGYIDNWFNATDISAESWPAGKAAADGLLAALIRLAELQ